MSNENKAGRPPKDRQTPLGRRVYELRKAKGWSQEKLAEVSGLTRDTILHVEHGLHTPRLATVMLLADALGVTLDYLAKGRGKA